MKRKIIVPLVTALMFGGAADCKKQNPGTPTPERQVPAPEADPGAQNKPGLALLQLVVQSSSSGAGGDVQYFAPETGPSGKWVKVTFVKHKDGTYGATWKQSVTAPDGATVSFGWFPGDNGRPIFAQCVIYHLGALADFQQGPDGPCAVSAKIR